MCNIAGYVGRETAAPRLIDMMQREEGFAGGYYTGIATFHEGRIYTAKVVGGLDRLLAETDAAQRESKTRLEEKRPVRKVPPLPSGTERVSPSSQAGFTTAASAEKGR